MADPEAITVAEEIESSGLFDSGWYLHFYPDVAASGMDPLDHYVRFGMAEGRHPNRYFDPKWYLRENADVAAAELVPFLHYLRHGDLEGRRPHPRFDPDWYRNAYALDPDQGALAHFLVHRAERAAAPYQELFAVPYLPAYRDGAGQGIDPFAHFLDDCESAGREPSPDLDLVRASGLIDANFYLINASDVHEADIDPALHYCLWGWRENRRPNLYFDVDWYIETNADLRRLHINPLVHYIILGEPGGRRPIPYFNPVWYRATYDVPDGQTALAHFLANRRALTVSPTPLFDVAWYVEQHREALGPNRDPFAHFLQVGTTQDIDPSPGFDAAAYRRDHLGRPSRAFRHLMRPDLHNPLAHKLRTEYR